MTAAVLDTNTREVENKIPDISGLVTSADTKIGEVENKTPDLSELITTNVLNLKFG